MSEAHEPVLRRVEQKDALLEAALDHVPFDGWSRQALEAAARDLDVDETTLRRLFPQGGDDLLAWFEDWADRRMLERVDPGELGRMRMRERIAALVRARLEILTPHREAVRRALAARMLPHNAIHGSRAAWRTVDRMWEAAGDQGGDGLNRYSKRALLAAVHASTLLYWLEDHSLDQQDSWAFLDRRIENVMGIMKLRQRLESMIPGGGRATGTG